jgi:hypothetical protein
VTSTDRRIIMNSVDLYFELHIVPLLRPADRLQMLGFFDLWDYDKVTEPENARKFRDRIALATTDPGLMPPLDSGGPWPQEWIDLVNRWFDSGAKRLGLAAADTLTARRRAGVGKIQLASKGSVAQAESAVWFDQRPQRMSPFEFVLYEKPGGPFKKTFSTTISFPDPGPHVTAIDVFDRNGAPHRVPIA